MALKIHRWIILTLGALVLGGCAGMNSLMSVEQKPEILSADEYGFEKYLTEQERVDLQSNLLSAIQSACQSIQGKWVAGSGWDTNRIVVSPRAYFTLMPEEQSQVLGVASFNPSQSSDIVVADVLSPPNPTSAH